jgi:hypothetical protein
MRRFLFCFALFGGYAAAQVPDSQVPDSQVPAAQVPAAQGYAGLQERWDHYLDRTFDWHRIGMLAAETAFNQTFQWNKCGRPPYCFPHEFGGALVRRTARSTIELGAGALMHEDIRRRPSGLNGFRPRVVFALKQSALIRNPEGQWRPAYSRFAGTFAGVAVSKAWDGRPMTAPQLFQGFGWSVSDYVQDSLLTEFEPDARRLAKRALKAVWKPRRGAGPLGRLVNP